MGIEQKCKFHFEIVFSAFIHVMVFILFWIIEGTHDFSTKSKENKWITLEVDTLLPKQKDLKKIVQSKNGNETAIAKKDSYLSDKTRTVQEEQVSINSSKKSDASNQKKQGDTARKLSQFGIPLFNSGNGQFNVNDAEKGEIINASDYIKGIKQSEFTALNTKEFIFFSYFQRIRSQLDLAWQPILREKVYKLYRSGRSLASDMDYVTQTVVTLNASGEVIRVQVVGESGAQDLDDAAIKAFNQAGPFPNPPKGLVDGQGRVQIRWEFVLKS